MKILFVAPVQFMDVNSPIFLAAQKKIVLIIRMLESIGIDVFILASSQHHNYSSTDRLFKKIHPEIRAKCFVPGMFINKKIGYFLNILNAKNIVDSVIKISGVPDYIWCYNAYAFEMRSAYYASNRYGVKIILEFEDWHFARSHTSPKAYIDWICWKLVVRKVSLAFVVNRYLRLKLLPHLSNIYYLPGLISKLAINHKSEFTLNNIPVCGYFGGLSTDKGAPFLLKIIHHCIKKNLPIKFIVTGSGEYAAEFFELSRLHSKTIKYCGVISNDLLADKYSQVDILLNPHVHMPGVFPFKVIEYASTGKLIISTPFDLDPEHVYIKKAIVTLDPIVEAWVDNILAWKSIYESNLSNLESVRVAVVERYSESAIESLLKRIFIIN